MTIRSGELQLWGLHDHEKARGIAGSSFTEFKVYPAAPDIPNNYGPKVLAIDRANSQAKMIMLPLRGGLHPIVTLHSLEDVADHLKD